MSQDQFETHFPTTVMQREHPDSGDLNSALFGLIAALEDKYRGTEHDAVKEGMVTTQGGYQTSTRMNLFTMKDEAIARFRDQILMPAARSYLERVFEDQAGVLNPWPVGWANVLRAGDWQGPHFHPTQNNVASGVYYVRLPADTPPPQGCIEFLNPIPESVHHGFPPNRRLHPREGKIVLFPPYYVHYVHPFRGPGERAIIAFDVLAQRPGFELVT